MFFRKNPESTERTAKTSVIVKTIVKMYRERFIEEKYRTIFRFRIEKIFVIITTKVKRVFKTKARKDIRE